MKKQFVYDPLISKRQQYLLATQVCTLICNLWFLASLEISHSSSVPYLKLVSLFSIVLIEWQLTLYCPDDVIIAGEAED